MFRSNRANRWHIFAFYSILFAISTVGCKKAAPPAAPVPEVQVITVVPTNVPVFDEWIGTLDGLVNAQIRAQVTGYLLTQKYAEGSHVKKGDLLFEIEPRPFQAALDEAQAKLAQDQAQFAKTELDVKRYAPLVKEQAISQETLDNAVQANLAGKAQVQADDAAVERARWNLTWAHITSPIDGVAGIALAQIGDLVGPSGPLLTTVSTIDPIKVNFQVNEQSYLSFWRRFVSGSETNEALALQLVLSDGSVYERTGKFYSADRQVNPNTGTLQIVGTFPNPDFALRPGQYGRVRAQTKMESNVFLVPQRAVTQLLDSYQVAVVTMDNGTNTSHLRIVKMGRQIGPNWVVEDGLKSGDRVVVEGALKAKENTAVNPQPFGKAQTNSAATNTAH